MAASHSTATVSTSKAGVLHKDIKNIEQKRQELTKRLEDCQKQLKLQQEAKTHINTIYRELKISRDEALSSKTEVKQPEVKVDLLLFQPGEPWFEDEKLEGLIKNSLEFKKHCEKVAAFTAKLNEKKAIIDENEKKFIAIKNGFGSDESKDKAVVENREALERKRREAKEKIAQQVNDVCNLIVERATNWVSQEWKLNLTAKMPKSAGEIFKQALDEFPLVKEIGYWAVRPGNLFEFVKYNKLMTVEDLLKVKVKISLVSKEFISSTTNSSQIQTPLHERKQSGTYTPSTPPSSSPGVSPPVTPRTPDVTEGVIPSPSPPQTPPKRGILGRVLSNTWTTPSPPFITPSPPSTPLSRAKPINDYFQWVEEKEHYSIALTPAGMELKRAAERSDTEIDEAVAKLEASRGAILDEPRIKADEDSKIVGDIISDARFFPNFSTFIFNLQSAKAQLNHNCLGTAFTTNKIGELVQEKEAIFLPKLPADLKNSSEKPLHDHFQEMEIAVQKYQEFLDSLNQEAKDLENFIEQHNRFIEKYGHSRITNALRDKYSDFQLQLTTLKTQIEEILQKLTADSSLITKELTTRREEKERQERVAQEKQREEVENKGAILRKEAYQKVLNVYSNGLVNSIKEDLVDCMLPEQEQILRAQLKDHMQLNETDTLADILIKWFSKPANTVHEDKVEGLILRDQYRHELEEKIKKYSFEAFKSEEEKIGGVLAGLEPTTEETKTKCSLAELLIARLRLNEEAKTIACYKVASDKPELKTALEEYARFIKKESSFIVCSNELEQRGRSRALEGLFKLRAIAGCQAILNQGDHLCAPGVIAFHNTVGGLSGSLKRNQKTYFATMIAQPRHSRRSNSFTALLLLLVEAMFSLLSHSSASFLVELFRIQQAGAVRGQQLLNDLAKIDQETKPPLLRPLPISSPLTPLPITGSVTPTASRRPSLPAATFFVPSSLLLPGQVPGTPRATDGTVTPASRGGIVTPPRPLGGGRLTINTGGN